MQTPDAGSWNERPATVLAVAVALLVVCAGFAYLWFFTDFLLARPLGLLSGSVGIYLMYGAVAGLREQREQQVDG